MRQILAIIFLAVFIVAVSQILGMTSARADIPSGNGKPSQSKFNVQDENGETALIQAVSGEHMDQVKKLLGAGADVNKVDKAGNTALLYAVSVGSMEMTKALIDHKANLKMQYGDKKENILFECARNDSEKIAEILIKKDQSLLKGLNSEGETPLFEAARSGAPKVAKLLVAQGMKADLKNKSGETAIEIARKNKLKDTLQALEKSK